MKKLTASSLSILLLVSIAHAGLTPLDAVYRLWDRTALTRIVEHYEAFLRNKPNSPQETKVLGIAYHNLGVLKTSGAVSKAVETLKHAQKLLPRDAEVLAYLGSANTLVARDSWNPVTKVREVQEGVKLIDQAVTREPENIAIRFVRATNSAELPKFFGRLRYVKSDLEHLVELSASNAAARAGLTPDMMAEVHLRLGDVYKDERNEQLAKEHWQKSVVVAPDSTWARDAKKRL